MAGIGRYLLRGLGVGSDIPHFVLRGLAPTGVVKTISVSPASVQTNQTGVLLTVTGTGTTWNSVGPSFSFSGVSGLSITNTTVLSDTSATITVNTGSVTGTATLTDATSGASATLLVFAPAPVAPPAPPGLVERDGAEGGYLVPTEFAGAEWCAPPPQWPTEPASPRVYPSRWRAEPVALTLRFGAHMGEAVFRPAVKQPNRWKAAPLALGLRWGADVGAAWLTEPVARYEALPPSLALKWHAAVSAPVFHDEKVVRDRADVARVIALEVGEPWLAEEIGKHL